MTVDIFEFWSQVGPEDRYHRKDHEVFARMKNTHGFDLGCLPSCFMGPLRTAPVVLLYLSPGLSEFDRSDAETSEGQSRVMECRAGNQMLPGPKDHKVAWEWWKQRTTRFGEWEDLRSKVAFLNICAYHSTTFGDY